MAPTTRSAAPVCEVEGCGELGHVCQFSEETVHDHQEEQGEEDVVSQQEVQQQQQQQQQDETGPGLGVSTRLRLRRVELEEDTIQVQVPGVATAGPSSQRAQPSHVFTSSSSASSSSGCAVASSSSLSSSSTATLATTCGGKSEKKGKPIRLGGPGKENVPPLVLNGHVLLGVDGSDDEDLNGDDNGDDEEDELNLRPASAVMSRRREPHSHPTPQQQQQQQQGMSVDVAPCSSPVAMPSSRHGKEPEHQPGTPQSGKKPVLRKSRTMGSLSGALAGPGSRSRSDRSDVLGVGIKTRSGKVAGTTTDCDSGMDVDVDGNGEEVFELTDKEDEDEGVALAVSKAVPEEDEDAKRRKRRRTEGGATTSSTSTSSSSAVSRSGRPVSGLISANNLQAIAEGGLNLPGPTGNPSSARSRFTSSGMRTRSGTTIMPIPRNGRARTGADTPSAASTSSGSGSVSNNNSGSLGASRLGRPRTLSQSSSHSSLNGVMMQVAAASASGSGSGNNNGQGGGNNTGPGRLSRSVSYAYGFPASNNESTGQSSRGQQGSERRTLRRSDSSRSSMSLKRKDREMSVSSMISVRSENMSVPPVSSSSMTSSSFSFFAPAQTSSSTSSISDPFASAFGSLSGEKRRLTPDMDVDADISPGESSISGGKQPNRLLFPTSSSTRKAPASPRRSSRKPRSTAVDDIPTSSPHAERLFSPSRAATPSHQVEFDATAADVNVTPRRTRRLQAQRDGSCTPTRTPAMSISDDISPSASQESEQIITPKISRIVSRLTLDQKLQQVANQQQEDQDGESAEDEGVVVGGPTLNPYKALKMALRCSSAGVDAGNVVVGREDEKTAVGKYLETGRIDGTLGAPRALYISGAPGTGKTALVTAISNELRGDGWNTAFVNCMGMTGGRKEDVWNRIVMAWGLEGKGERAVETGLRAAPASERRLLILDEVDALLTSTSSANANNTLRNLFTLPSTYAQTTVRVIAISNSLDLTARRSISSALAELSPDNLSFTAYGSKEMIAIVKSRIAAVKADAMRDGRDVVEMDEKAIELVGRKVEVSNGDLRMCLNVMVEAVGTAEADWKRKSTAAQSASTPKGMGSYLESIIPPTKVALHHVLKALTSSIAKLKANIASSSPSSGGSGGAVETKVRSLNVQVKSILLALLVARQRVQLGLRPAYVSAQSASFVTGTSSNSGNNNGNASAITNPDRITLELLLPTYAHLLNHASSSLSPVGQTDFMDLLMQAEVIGLVSLGSSSCPLTPTKTPSRRANKRSGSGKDRTVELMVKDEDLVRALGLAPLAWTAGEEATKPVGVMESEMRGMWTREESRWRKALEGKSRQAETAERNAARGQLGFDED